MAFTVVYDACILFPVALRDLFIRLGQTGLFRAKWTEQILDEWQKAVVVRYPDAAQGIARQRELMRDAIRDVDVRGYAKLIPVVPTLPDPGDAHVVAAAMESKAEVIVTFNLGHFPAAVLGPLNIAAQHPDAFVRHLIDLDREVVEDVIEQMAAAKAKPPMTYDDVLEVLAKRGLAAGAACGLRPILSVRPGRYPAFAGGVQWAGSSRCQASPSGSSASAVAACCSARTLLSSTRSRRRS